MSRFIPKIKLVTCDGKGPRAWIRKFIKYFEVYNIHGEHRVAIESPFLIDKSDAWYHNWIQSEGSHSWAEFERELCVRFGEEGLEDVIEELMRTRQEGNMEEYQDRFEDIRIRVERVMPSLGEAYFSSVFIGELRDDIRPIVRMLKPNTLASAFQIARFQEQFLIGSRRTNASFKPTSSNFKPSNPTFTTSSPDGNVTSYMFRLSGIADVSTWGNKCKMLLLSHYKPCARYKSMT